MDDVLVVKRVLDAEEIRDLSQGGVVKRVQQPEKMSRRPRFVG